MKSLIVSLSLLGTAAAHADYRCETYALGKTYWETRSDYSEARFSAVARCKRDRNTADSQCERNISCQSIGERGGPRGGKTPTVQSKTCYVAQTAQWVTGDRFFSLVHEWAVSHRACAVAKIATVASSGRIYDRDGVRVDKSAGGLSNNEVDDALRALGLSSCERFSCEEQVR